MEQIMKLRIPILLISATIILGDFAQLEIKIEFLQRVDDAVTLGHQSGKLMLLFCDAASAPLHEGSVKVHTDENKNCE
jgi:hypothetical protein